MTDDADLLARVEEALRGDPALFRMLGASDIEGLLRRMHGGPVVVTLADGTRVRVWRGEGGEARVEAEGAERR